MSIEHELKKTGIEVISELDNKTVQDISKYVAEEICKKFPNLNFDFEKLFLDISNIPMYIANISNSSLDANYFYKNSSIYFRNNLENTSLKKIAIHEIIHHLQEVKDKKNNLCRIGLCSLESNKIIGCALNEAAVQTVSSYIAEEKPEIVCYYGIEFLAISKNVYPLICNLLGQMCYITGEDALYDSVFKSNNTFKNKFINQTNKYSFNKIQKNFDLILNLEENIFNIYLKFENESSPQKNKLKYQNKINSDILKIRNTYFETQKIIFTSFFDNKYNSLKSESDIELYKKRFSIYKELIGVNDSYSDFSKYYSQKTNEIELNYEKIITKKFPSLKSKNKLILFIEKLLDKFKK